MTAKVICYNVRKVADRNGVGFLLATTHEDIIDDLQPDVIVRCRGGGVVEVENRRPFRGSISFHRRLEITEGAASDWPYFARWHYRGRGLGPVRKVLLLWHGWEPIGICIFGFGPLSSSARNDLFGLRGPLTTALAGRINRNFASVARLVLDPRYRGAGLASALLRRCCKMAPWPWIELVSEMAALVPFCQAAGFKTVAKTSSKTDRFMKSRRRGDSSAGVWGKSNWTDKTFRNYLRRVRFSRPTYYIFDNRQAETNRRHCWN